MSCPKRSVKHLDTLLPFLRQGLFALLFVILAALTGAPAHAFNKPYCERSLEELMADLTHRPDFNERQLLQAFNPAAINGKKIERLDYGSSFRVRGDGLDYVARLPSIKNDLKHEQFSIAFLNASPLEKGLAVRLLSLAESQVFLEKLNESQPSVYLAMREEFEKINLDPEAVQISVTIFAPAQKGTDALAEWNVSDSIRDNLRQFVKHYTAGSERLFESTIHNYIKEIGWAWEGFSAAQKRVLVQDLRNVAPDLAHLSESNFQNNIETILKTLTLEHAQSLYRLSFLRMPKAVLEQLANYWLVYTVLGIRDFHAGNWLIHLGRVIPIDLALPTTVSTSDNPLMLPSEYHPMGLESVTPGLFDYLIKMADPVLKSYLTHISPQQIKIIAKNAKYPLTENELADIMKRVHHLGRLTGETGGVGF